MADSLTSGQQFNEMVKELAQANKSLLNLEKMDAATATTADLLKLDEARTKVRDKEKQKRESEEKAESIRQQAALDKLTGFGKFSKKMQMDAAKKAKLMAGKVKDFAVEKIAGIKKAAGSLLDILMKGLGLLALWGLFKWIQSWDIEAMSDAAKKVAEVITSLTTGLLGIGGWLGIDKIRKFFGGKESKLVHKIKGMILSARIWMLQFTGKGSFLGKLGNMFKSFMGIFGKIPGIGKIMKFIKGAAKFLGKIFLPVTVIMALWEAVTGFMDGFGNTEGNFFQKMLGGIGGALKGLLDFFVFGIAEMVQDAIVWLLELFGFDSAAMAVGDFNLVGRIKDAVFKAIDFVTELFSFRDTSFSGIVKSLVDILMLPLNLAINFLKDLFGWGDPEEPFKFSTFIIDAFNTVVDWFKGLFAWGAEAGATEDGGWSISKFIGEVIDKVKGWVTGLFSWAASEDEEDSFIASTIKKTITGVKEWFGKMFKFDSASDILASAFNVLTFFPNLIKDALLSVTEWLLGLFGFGEEAKKVANAKNFSIGDMIVTLLDKLVTWLSELFNFDIKAIIAESLGALGDAGKKVMGWLGFGGKEIEKEATGGPVGKGVPILVGEHGPELFVPSGSGRILPKMQTETAMAGAGGGAPIIMSAPTTNVSGGSSTTMAVASSSINPMHNKYFRN